MSTVYLLTPRGITCLDYSAVLRYLAANRKWAENSIVKAHELFQISSIIEYFNERIDYQAGSKISVGKTKEEVIELTGSISLFSKEGYLVSPRFYTEEVMRCYNEQI